MLRRFAAPILALLVFSMLSLLSYRPHRAEAQQVASQYVCATQLDGGVGTVICGTFLSNYEPFTTTCSIRTLGYLEQAGATIALYGSGDGSHYGVIADAGYSWVVSSIGDGGVTSSTVGFAISPTDPWLNYEILATGVSDDGGTSSTGWMNCQISVIQSQTLHAKYPGGLKSSLPKAKRVVQ